MCVFCFRGLPVSNEELAGEEGRSVDRLTQRRYYERNRTKVLSTHRNLRESRKLTACAAS